ncbi:MAG: hypothetical protein KDD62_11205, partial [Bdellovibrionales bacterium]|nr:hypothetical protein [Bdellovibrionales bacterium]
MDRKHCLLVIGMAHKVTDSNFSFPQARLPEWSASHYPEVSAVCSSLRDCVAQAGLNLPGVLGPDRTRLFGGREVGTPWDFQASQRIHDAIEAINRYNAGPLVELSFSKNQPVRFSERGIDRQTSLRPLLGASDFFQDFSFIHPYRLSFTSSLALRGPDGSLAMINAKRSDSDQSQQQWGAFCPEGVIPQRGEILFLGQAFDANLLLTSHVQKNVLTDKWICAYSASMLMGQEFDRNGSNSYSNRALGKADLDLLDYAHAKGARGVLFIHPPLHEQSIASHIVSKMIRDENALDTPKLPVVTLPRCTLARNFPGINSYLSIGDRDPSLLQRLNAEQQHGAEVI